MVICSQRRHENSDERNQQTTLEKMKLKPLVENTAAPESLVRAVVRQMGGWDNFKESAPDVARHGIDGGFCGFVYYSDTLPFAERNRRAIADLAQSQADDLGMGTLEMIQSFGCLGSDYSLDEIGRCLYGSGDDTQILNALAWYAAEEVCRAYDDTMENAA